MATASPSPSVIEASLMLCDAAVVAEGKLYIHGGSWHDVNPPAYPTMLQRIALALTITVPYLHTNEAHRLTLHLENSDGELQVIGMNAPAPGDPSAVPTPMTELNAEFNLGRPPQLQRGDAQTVPLAINVDGLAVPQADSYSFVVLIDGTEVERTTFRAMPAAVFNL